jgi:hypothetical protein
MTYENMKNVVKNYWFRSHEDGDERRLADAIGLIVVPVCVSERASDGFRPNVCKMMMTIVTNI